MISYFDLVLWTQTLQWEMSKAELNDLIATMDDVHSVLMENAK